MIPSDYFDYARRRESGGDPFAKNPNSSATGLYQFTEGTWNDLAKSRPDLGLTPDGRTDPSQQKRAMEAFTNTNAGVLSAAGLPTDNEHLYAAHRFGAQGALSAYAADPETPAVNHFPADVFEKNPDLSGKTVGEVLGSAQASYKPSKDKSVAQVQTVFPRGPLFAQDPNAPQPDDSGLSLRDGGVLFYNGKPKYDLGDSLVGAGAAVAGISSPAQGAALASMYGGNNKNKFTTHYDANTGTMFQIDNKTGAVNSRQVPSFDPNLKQKQAYQEEQGKAFGKLNDDIYNNAQTASQKLGQIDQAKAIFSNPDVYQGKGGEWVQDAKKLGASLGMQTDGVSAGDLARNIANQYTLEARQLNGGMPGSLSDKDLAFLQKSTLSLENQPEANMQILDNYKAIHQRAIDVNNMRTQYIKEHGRLDEGFRQQVTDFANANPVFGPTNGAAAPAAAPSNRPPLDSYKF